MARYKYNKGKVGAATDYNFYDNDGPGAKPFDDISQSYGHQADSLAHPSDLPMG